MNTFSKLARLSLIGCAAALAWGTQASAATVVTLGDQDFADGAAMNVAAFQLPQAGEPAPFGVFIGNDFGTNGSTSFTFTYAAGTATAGSLTFGIYDHDSRAPGNQVASFTLDGVDLTADLNTLFESHGGLQAEVSLYTLALSGAALGALSDGSATFSLALTGPGLQGSPGTTGTTTDFNGFGLDFARLEVAAVPEPETYALMLAGLAALGFVVKRRRTA